MNLAGISETPRVVQERSVVETAGLCANETWEVQYYGNVLRRL